ncbi:MAG: TldD/PmbA family protein [Acetatifactor sp.]|nr:TldD/PmbA family protein [Acetatifactor sp.]
MKYYYMSYSNLGGAEVLSRMEADVEKGAGITLELLDSEPMVPGEYDCICAPDVTGMIVHEAFGHGVEMDMFVKKRALAQKYVGEYVASSLVTMHDGASAASETATYFFDDEGTMAHDTVVIDKGILKQGISDLQSALILGTEPTGNGRRESYRRKAYTRMTNTYFEGGKDTVEDMIASVDYGFLLENPSSGMEDPKNWGIQCMVNIAREIRDGKLTGKIFSPIVLTGYVPDLLKSISMMSADAELNGGGMCGKGYKEWVKVSDGGPYIKARIRLG